MERIETVIPVRAPIERCFDLARSVEAHLAENVHCGARAEASGGVTSGLVGRSERVTWRARHFGLWFRLTSEITAFDRPAYFEDRMVIGPFRSMRHEHLFRAESPDRTTMTDILTFAAPLPVLGRISEVLVLRRYMRRLLEERVRVLQRIAESDDWRRYLA